MCVQVVQSKLAGFVARVKTELKESDAYLRINSERQRRNHLAVLGLIAEQNRPVRRREIVAACVPGGDSRDKKKFEVPMTNNELERVLERLVKANFIERSSYYERRGRRGRRVRDKRAVFYVVSEGHILVDDTIEDPVEIASMNEGCASIGKMIEEYWSGPKARVRFIRRELEEDLASDVSDDDFEALLKNIGFLYGRDDERCIRWWATRLPMEQSKLSRQILKYLDERGEPSKHNMQ